MTKKNHNFLCCSLRKEYVPIYCTHMYLHHISAPELEKNKVSYQDIEAKNKGKMEVSTQIVENWVAI